MKLLISEGQLNKMLTVVKKLINTNDFNEVCDYIVEPPTPDMNTFKVTIYVDESKLLELKSFRLIRDRIDEIVNKTWEKTYNFLNVPLSVYIWKIPNC